MTPTRDEVLAMAVATPNHKDGPARTTTRWLPRIIFVAVVTVLAVLLILSLLGMNVSG